MGDRIGDYNLLLNPLVHSWSQKYGLYLKTCDQIGSQDNLLIVLIIDSTKPNGVHSDTISYIFLSVSPYFCKIVEVGKFMKRNDIRLIPLPG